MPNPVLGYLSHRVVDNNTGAEVVGDLPHLHQTAWKVRGLQPGVTGSASLGTFAIPLYPADSGEGESASAAYDALKVGQRIEAYWSGTGGATPYQSGIITHIDKPGDGPWVVSGADSLWILQQSQLFQGETIGPSSGPALLVNLMSATREVVYDQWTTLIGSPHLTLISGAASNVTADPQFGLPGLSSTGFAVLLESTSWNAGSQYNWPTHPSDAYGSQITIWGTILADTNVTNSGGVGIAFLSDATFANGYLVEMVSTYTAPTWAVSVKIWSQTAGAFTLLASQSVFTGLPSSTIPYQLSAVLYQQGSNYTIRVLLNGKDTGCVAVFTSLVRSSGQIGVRPTSAGASTQYVNRMRFESRTGQYGSGTWGTNRFQVGSATSTTAVIPFITSQSQTHLDVITLAMALDGFVCLKTAGRGYKSDTLTYGNLGADLTASVVVREADNVDLAATTIGPVADMFATSTRYSAVPGDTSGGTIEWPGPLAAAGDMVLVDTVTDIGAPGVSLQLGNAIQVAARKANPIAAYTVALIRTPDVAEQFTLYDRVLIDLPTLRVNRLSQQVIGWDFTEGQAVQTVYLNQFPMASTPQVGLERIRRVTEWLAQHQS